MTAPAARPGRASALAQRAPAARRRSPESFGIEPRRGRRLCPCGHRRAGARRPVPRRARAVPRRGRRRPRGPRRVISPCLLTPRSRGSVRLASDDPIGRPIVHNAFYTAGDDSQRMVAALRLALTSAPSPPWSTSVPSRSRRRAATPRRRCASTSRATTIAFYHPVGTCRMGEDPNAVVDRAVVRRRPARACAVIDASVMPAAPRGNTNAPTIALAERAAM